MKKTFSRYLLPAACFLLAVFLTGCFEDEITFRGYVLRATLVDVFDQTGALIETRYRLDGPVHGAIVRCVGYSEAAITDASGAYNLEIKVTRVIGFKAKSEDYILQAFSSSSGTDEYISQYVDARPGDTVQVRDFVLTQHTREGGSD